MRAAVLEGVDRAVIVARDHDRHFSEARATIGVGAGQFRFQAEEIPGPPAKDALLFLRIEILVGIDPVGHAREAFAGPLAASECNCHGESPWRVRARYSILMPAVFITLAQRSVSSRMKAAVAAGSPPPGSADRVA